MALAVRWGGVDSFRSWAEQVEYLTHFTASHGGALFVAECGGAGGLVQELDEPVRLFDGDLGEPAMLVEDAKQITLGNFLGGQVSCETRAQWLNVSFSGLLSGLGIWQIIQAVRCKAKASKCGVLFCVSGGGGVRRMGAHQ